jgi:transposase
VSESRRPYPGVLTDAEWALTAPLLPASEANATDGLWSHRLVAEATLFVAQGGFGRRMLPRAFPPRSAAFTRLRLPPRRSAAPRAHGAR